MYYTTSGGSAINQKGIIGTLRADPQSGALRFEWSTTSGFDVAAFGSNFGGTESYYHGDLTGKVYIHESGNSFNGAAVTYNYKTSEMDFGDSGLRKTLHYMNLSAEPEGTTDIKLNWRFNFAGTDVIQPPQTDIGSLSFGAEYGTAKFGTDVYGVSAPLKLSLIHISEPTRPY